MRFFIMPVLFSALLLGVGCATSRVVEDDRSPEIIINRFGEVLFHGKRINPDEIVKAVTSAGIKKTTKIWILIPGKDNCDEALMKNIQGRLAVAGYWTVFVSDRKATATDKKEPTVTPFTGTTR